MESEGVGEDLLAEGALMVLVFLSHFLLVSLEVLIFDAILVEFGFDVDLATGLTKTSSVVDIGLVSLSEDSCLACVVKPLQSRHQHHHLNYITQYPFTSSLSISNRDYRLLSNDCLCLSLDCLMLL